MDNIVHIIQQTLLLSQKEKNRLILFLKRHKNSKNIQQLEGYIINIFQEQQRKLQKIIKSKTSDEKENLYKNILNAKAKAKSEFIKNIEKQSKDKNLLKMDSLLNAM